MRRILFLNNERVGIAKSMKYKNFLLLILLFCFVGCATTNEYKIVDRRDVNPAKIVKNYKHEKEYIKKRRKAAAQRSVAAERECEFDALNTVGMAFSGGGLRSATFNLGVLQAMEEKDKLRKVDYLSAVSGGAYISSWYVSHLLPFGEKDRRSRDGVIVASSDPKKLLKRTNGNSTDGVVSPGQIDHLQNSSSFLLSRNWGLPGLAAKYFSLIVPNLIFDVGIHFKPLRGKWNWYHPFYLYRKRIEETYLQKWMMTDFTEDEFNDEIDNANTNLSPAAIADAKKQKKYQNIKKFCTAIKNDWSNDLDCGFTDFDCNELNHFLAEPNFYDAWVNKRKSFKFREAQIKTLAHKTRKYRYSFDNKEIVKNPTIQGRDYYLEKIKRLNRLVLEEAYPQLCPKSEPEFLLQDINPDNSEAPYLIINGTLGNRNTKRNRTKKREKGEMPHFVSPFEFTRDFCGSPFTGYVDTKAFDKTVHRVDFNKEKGKRKFPIKVLVSDKKPLWFSVLPDTKPFPLANAVTASGAAVDSTGFTGPLRFITDAAFKGINMNTRYETRNFSQSSASWYAWPYDRLIREFIFDRIGPTVNSNSLHISDGNHYENFGIVALVKRRVKTIYVFDASADPDYEYDSLKRSIKAVKREKCSSVNCEGFEWEFVDDEDENVVVKFPPDKKNKNFESKMPDKCIFKGKITCKCSNCEYEAKVYYCKSTIDSDVPEYVYNFDIEHRRFPHTSTTLQWYDMNKFEAYRQLGFHVGTKLIKKINKEY